MGKSRTYLNDILERRNKDQFLNSNDTVGQIAYSLGFEYPHSAGYSRPKRAGALANSARWAESAAVANELLHHAAV